MVSIDTFKNLQQELFTFSPIQKASVKNFINSFQYLLQCISQSLEISNQNNHIDQSLISSYNIKFVLLPYTFIYYLGTTASTTHVRAKKTIH